MLGGERKLGGSGAKKKNKKKKKWSKGFGDPKKKTGPAGRTRMKICTFVFTFSSVDRGGY